MVQGGGFEPPKLARQIYSLIPLATREPLRVLNISAAHRATSSWSWREESNPRPADYKSAALPTELRQQLFLHVSSRSIYTLAGGAVVCGGGILVKVLSGSNI